jgi:hypothetical protein
MTQMLQGMSLGKEGPLVHVAVCWAQQLSRFFPQILGRQVSTILNAWLCADPEMAGHWISNHLRGIIWSPEFCNIFLNCALCQCIHINVLNPMP